MAIFGAGYYEYPPNASLTPVPAYIILAVVCLPNAPVLFLYYYYAIVGYVGSLFNFIHSFKSHLVVSINKHFMEEDRLFSLLHIIN